MGDDDEKMGDASLPPLTFGAAGASGDWAADVEHEHEASGRNADVLELEREKARKRAERFGQAFKEPSKKTLAGAHGLLSRKEVLAVRKERAMKKAARGGQFVTGIDLFDPEEEAKRAARAAKFGAMLDAAPEQRALAERRSAERAARDARPRRRATPTRPWTPARRRRTRSRIAWIPNSTRCGVTTRYTCTAWTT